MNIGHLMKRNHVCYMLLWDVNTIHPIPLCKLPGLSNNMQIPSSSACSLPWQTQHRSHTLGQTQWPDKDSTGTMSSSQILDLTIIIPLPSQTLGSGNCPKLLCKLLALANVIYHNEGSGPEWYISSMLYS